MGSRSNTSRQHRIDAAASAADGQRQPPVGIAQPGAQADSGSSEHAVRLYRAMRRIRRVEEQIERVYPTDKIKSPVHLSTGQEAASVGVCDALRPDDVVFATYRGHAAYLAKGGNLRAMIAELYGKADGCARGKAGSMHLIDVAAGFMGTSAIVGTTIPQAVGHAFAMKYKRADRVTVAFFGDGATEEGTFHESMNFAALKRLPILFVCENNLYAIHSHVRDRAVEPDLSRRAASYRMPARRIEDGDVLAINAAAKDAVEAIRRGEGPQFIEVMTYRYCRHVGPGGDTVLGYRTQSEIDQWKARDPIAQIGESLPIPTRTMLDAEIEIEIADAFEFAERSPFPGGDELVADVFHG
ncbi:MAG TPA: thiamine pyrophosphate-dependent dehydrogenase E1 component subunit alpha [Alphaproteobacteria bacterium]|nr:thiamine pyrophosphate-dependent dehydrogenase E1 component subunit alpha [Alphaproteobacteria bacterium]